MGRMSSSVAGMRHGLHVARNRGAKEFASRGLKRLQGIVDDPGIEYWLHVEDLIRPLVRETTNPVLGNERPRVGFVVTPPGASSGGHKTLSRVVEGLADAGMECRILLYDFWGDDIERHAPVVRRLFPRASLSNARDWAPGDLHAVFATSTESAQFIARSHIVGKRFYLVQDFEPWFYPKGTAWELAEQTYSLGFHGIAIGSWLPDFISQNYGMACDAFPFACDVSDYGLHNASERRGIAFYARPSTHRRAFGLGILALGLVHEARPELELHLFGERTGWKHFPVVDHGSLTPQQLNGVYNSCVAGLALSMTNVSLVPWEMLAAGCIPVVNEMPETLTTLDNQNVRYARPTPEELASALLEVVDGSPSLNLAEVSRSVQTISWADSIANVTRAVKRELVGQA